MTETVTMNTLVVAMVEDDPDVALLVTDVIPGVHHFPTGEAAVEALTTSQVRPGFVLLDLELPGMDGLEVLRRLRAHPTTRRLPVIIFTGTDTDPDLGYRLGANAWVRKPSDVDDMVQALQGIEAFWGRLNRPSR